MSIHPIEFPKEPKEQELPVSRATSIADLTSSNKKENVVLEDLFEDDDAVDRVYHAKARVLNQAIQEIGFGRYQVYLFCCAGFGWFA
jgi:hypothetical protein